MSKWDSFPVIAREALKSYGENGATEERGVRGGFPFVSWAMQNGFRFPEWAEPVYRRCESAAEAYFLRPFVDRPNARAEDGSVIDARGTIVTPQVVVFRHRIDYTVVRNGVRLGAEVDGLAFHRQSQEQASADYLRDRRILLAGYSVVRFTAQEVFCAAAECWRQLDCILDAMEAHR